MESKVFGSCDQPEFIDLVSDSEDDDIIEITEDHDKNYITFDSDEKEAALFSDDSLTTFEKFQQNAKFVDHKEWKTYRDVNDEIRRKVRRSPILREHFDMNIPSTADRQMTRMRAIRLHQHIYGDVTVETAPKKKKFDEPQYSQRDINFSFFKLRQDYRYQPPERRILIKKNLSSNPEYPLSMFCDKVTLNPNNVEIDSSMIFEYIQENSIGQEDIPTLKNFIKLSKDNIITCNCRKTENNLAMCWENPNCKCYIVNKKLSKLQKLSPYRPEKTRFKTFEKIKMRDIDNYFDTFAFCCSSNCECEGCCDNNVMYPIEQNINRFEVFRYDAKGFGLRPLNFIPFGQPVFEFAGEIVSNENVILRGSHDYAFRMSDFCDEFMRLITKLPYLSDDLKYELKRTLGKGWHVDPKTRGNEGRFVGHGCHPNLAMCRVFREGFGPHQTKFMMITLEDIFPGTSLSFDYGKNYVEQQLQGKCLCQTPACKNNEWTGPVYQATFEDMFSFLSFRHYLMAEDYRIFVTERRDPVSIEGILDNKRSDDDEEQEEESPKWTEIDDRHH